MTTKQGLTTAAQGHLGIDLGNTNGCVAVQRVAVGGAIEVVANEQGSRITHNVGTTMMAVFIQSR